MTTAWHVQIFLNSLSILILAVAGLVGARILRTVIKNVGAILKLMAEFAARMDRMQEPPR